MLMPPEKMKMLQQKDFAPWIALSTIGIYRPRRSGGNLFRHQFMTWGILIDYGIIDAVLLKASLIHDLMEDVEGFNHQLIIECDNDGPEVYKLANEVTKRRNESKANFLTRILNEGSDRALLLKSADRISNLSDNQFLTDKVFLTRLCDESEKYVLSMTEKVCSDMTTEMKHKIARVRGYIDSLS
jgi:GTP pyrophosphokinase